MHGGDKEAFKVSDKGLNWMTAKPHQIFWFCKIQIQRKGEEGYICGGRDSGWVYIVYKHCCGSHRPGPSRSSGLSIWKSAAVQMIKTSILERPRLLVPRVSKILAEEAINQVACLSGSTFVFLWAMISQKRLAPLFWDEIIFLICNWGCEIILVCEASGSSVSKLRLDCQANKQEWFRR